MEKRIISSIIKVQTQVVKVVPYVMDAGVWIIGNGRCIKAWSYNWLGPEKSIMEYQVQILEELLESRLSDLIDDNGEWNWSLLQDWMPSDIFLQNVVHYSSKSGNI